MVRADIMQGHVLERLRELPDNSVDLCITSPPYWGLRDYGLPPLTWPAVEYAPMAGLPPISIPGDMDCEHEWGVENFINKTGGLDKSLSYTKNQFVQSSSGQFCQKCGAWRGSLGLEPTIEMFVGHLVLIFREVRRVMAKHAVCLVNLGDSYSTGPLENKEGKMQDYDGVFTRRFNRQLGHGENRKEIYKSPLKPKDLCGVPWRVALALQADGFWLRTDIIWAKNNCMPESVTDRPTRSHEYVFLLAKSVKYYWDAEAVKVDFADKRMGNPKGGGHYARNANYPNKHDNQQSGLQKGTWNENGEKCGRNLRTVWTIPSAPMSCGLCAKCGKYWHIGAPQQHCGQQTVGHFAAFPPKLVEPMIKAGSSEEGYCPKCGKPWGRVVEKTRPDTYNPSEVCERTQQGWGGKGFSNNRPLSSIFRDSLQTKTETTGWQLICACGLDPRPGVVLDIFGGAMTTAIVAAKLGRDSISCELNPDYVRMGVNRLKAELGMLANVEVK